MATVGAELVAKYRDQHLAEGKSNNTVHIELAMLGHLFRTAIQEWGIGLTFNPVANIRKPIPGTGRDRQLTVPGSAEAIFQAANGHSNPMLGLWIVRLAVETGVRSSEIGACDVRRWILSDGLSCSETRRTVRVVPLTRAAAVILGEALANPVRPIDTDLIFFGEPGHEGKRKPYVVQKRWAGVVRELGFADAFSRSLS